MSQWSEVMAWGAVAVVSVLAVLVALRLVVRLGAWVLTWLIGTGDD